MTDGSDGSSASVPPARPSPPQPQASAPPLRPGWYGDPSDRFDLRYHNGFAWTGDVSKDGERFVDPYDRSAAASTPHDAGLAAHTAPTPEPAKNPIATAAMVVGICSICLAWLPILVFVGGVLAVLALVFGVVGRRRAAERGLDANRAVLGLITGAIGLACVVVGIALTVVLFRAIDRWDNPADHEITLTRCESDMADTGTGRTWGAAVTLVNTGDSSAEFTAKVTASRTESGGAGVSVTEELGRIEPGESVDFEFVGPQVLTFEPVCSVEVFGPLPFGVDLS